MTPKNNNRVVLYAGAAALAMICGGEIHASDAADTDRQLQELRSQNQALQQQLRQQQSLVESLSRKVESKSPKVERFTFENAGRVDVFCSIHTRMSCIVLVLQNPWFAATNAKGDYTIKDVPPGVYKLKAWHERLPSQIKDITISEAVPTVKADFILGFADPPKS